MRLPVIPLVALAVGACVAGCCAQVTITAGEDSFIAKGAAYEATVSTKDGCMTGLKVAGNELFTTEGDFPRGAYMYQDGILRLPQVSHSSETTVTAESDQAAVRYEFGPDTQTWTLSNKTDKTVLMVIVLDPAVRAVRDAAGFWEKAPTEQPWTEAAWFRDGARLIARGTTRVWGPWGEGHQILQVDIPAGESRELKLQIGTPTEEEAKLAMETVNRIVEPPQDPEGPMWDLERFAAPPQTYPAEGFEAEGVRAVFYEGVPFRGRPTRVFAWIGLPEVKPGEKVPGMVLVHGGGGTAFENWVRLWTSRGYAAIAMDTCGCVPKGSYGNWQRHPYGGPAGWGGAGQIDWAREDQWTFHAVADALLAHSLLRSLPEVDPDRIGLTGISWGGYLSCIIAGVDSRLRFVAPVYGCGYYLDTNFGGMVRGLGGERTERWMRWWDPSAYLPDAAMPMLWVTGSNDFHYWFPGLQKSYRAAPGDRTLCIRLRMPHGHGPAGEGPQEIGVFADSILKDGAPLPTFTGQGRDGASVWATYESAVPIARAELNYTLATGNWPDREWIAAPASLDEPGKVTATLPEGTRVYYINLFDDRDCVVSTEHVELEGQ